MLYLHDGHIRELGMDWKALVDLMEGILRIKDSGDSVHPLKPYLRFRAPENRIIAMPAYVGGSVDMSGIKWIASFPGNRQLGLPRAHNTLILNHTSTGEPLAVLYSGMLNGIRTAAVSGVMLTAFQAARQLKHVRVGIIGWGPVGQMHLRMCKALLGDRLERVRLYDLQHIDPQTVPADVRNITDIADTWQSVYQAADILITCTVSEKRYIDQKPAEGMLLLHVSLRDYTTDSVANLKAIVVDEWQEVCRENTDIELLHLNNGLQEADVLTLADIVCRDGLNAFEGRETVFFNPMGLAVFDIGVASYYYQKARQLGIGNVLEQA
ncbi:2,3-diaminopropionate biosynthesis protein SbnB [Paenibacillus sp. JCM 10914]|uniref:ornithine cyclodeaminase n=1 Tax=Paenibacillus sp. JCM 10914 TaxID=1236974 RepID=UPI0003CC62C0|nr:ornithine cyclodeaminase [Paenibacillus sp. JCM 10914]GAE09234.1 ornithine cyclodeaminase [Paenibacillus sp. JCM 10914]